MFNFSEPELLTFFAVLVRYSTLVMVLPITGDRMVPGPVKVLFALAVTVALFPALVTRGVVNPGEAIGWGSSAYGIASTVALEAIFGLVLGYTARLTFDSIMVGGNLAGTFMGFAAASTFDPHQESQSQVVAEIQMVLAMMVFLSLDGHHSVLRSALDSYRVVGIGQMGFGQVFQERIIELTGNVLKFGIQIAAPVAVALFAVNIAFGVLAKAMPQLNILVLSFAVTSLVGLFVMYMSIPEFQVVSGNILAKTEDWMYGMAVALQGK